MPAATVRRSAARRFQTSSKIINAFSPAIGFDGGVKRPGDNLILLTACYRGSFGGLIVTENQHRADL
jgi:hypothetical protein